MCGQTCRGWEAFKKHYSRSHKLNIELEMNFVEPEENMIIDETPELNEGFYKNIAKKIKFLNFKLNNFYVI